MIKYFRTTIAGLRTILRRSKFYSIGDIDRHIREVYSPKFKAPVKKTKGPTLISDRIKDPEAMKKKIIESRASGASGAEVANFIGISYGSFNSLMIKLGWKGIVDVDAYIKKNPGLFPNLDLSKRPVPTEKIQEMRNSGLTYRQIGKKMCEKVRNFRAPNIQVECASFEDIMEKHRDDFLYLDPPYYLDGDSKTFVGLFQSHSPQASNLLT